MLVVDASVIIKMFAPEAGSDAIAGLMDSEQQRLVPAHAYAEVCEGLARKTRNGELTEAQLDRIVPALMRGFISIALDDLLDPALKLSVSTGASVYDCLYVALAVTEDCRFVTADRKLIARMAKTPFAPLLMPLDSFSGSP